MRVGDTVFLVSWTIFVVVVGGWFFPSWFVAFVGCSYVLTGVIFASTCLGRLRLILGWYPAFISCRVYDWVLRGGDTLGGEE